MNPREHLLAIGLLVGLVVAGGGFLFKQVYLPELEDRRAAIEKLRADIQDREDRIAQLQRQRGVLDVARQLSLPADVDLDRREYQKYLEGLFRQSGFASGSFTITAGPPDLTSSPKLPGRKEPIYTSLPFLVKAHGNLASLVEAMERFYHTGLLHRIKGLSIRRPLTTTPQPQMPQQRTGELDIELTIEALVLSGAEQRSYLLPNINKRLLVIDVVTAMRKGPPGLALVPWAVGPAGPNGPHKPAEPPRQFASIPGKNIFFGPQLVIPDRREDVELTRYVFLTHIHRDAQRAEAFLFDRYNNRHTRLRTTAGFDSFRVLDHEGEAIVRGKVLQIIDEREVIFRVDENYFCWHIGESLEQAMKTPLSADQLNKLGMVAAPVKKNGAGQ